MPAGPARRWLAAAPLAHHAHEPRHEHQQQRQREQRGRDRLRDEHRQVALADRERARGTAARPAARGSGRSRRARAGSRSGASRSRRSRTAKSRPRSNDRAVQAVGAERREHEDAGVEQRPRDRAAAAPTAPTSGRLSTSSITLPMYRLAISAQTSVGCVWNSSGPGCRPYCWNAASRIAAVAEVGRPSVSSGTSTPAADALFAASGPATPSIAPWPNSSGCLRQLLLDRVGQERRNLGAAGRQHAERKADRGAAQPRLPRAPPVVARHPERARASSRSSRRRGSAYARDVQRLADREQPDRDHDDVDAVEQLGHAEREARLPGQQVDADEAEQQAEEQARRARAPPTARAPRTTVDEREHHQREVLGRPEPQRAARRPAARAASAHRGDRAGDERADRRGRERRAARGRAAPSGGPRARSRSTRVSPGVLSRIDVVEPPYIAP